LSRSTAEPGNQDPLRAHQLAIVALAVPLQLLSLYMVPLVYECDAQVYFTYDAASTYRPPVYAIFLWLTGQHFLHTFVGTVVAHAALGVLAPILVYRTLAPFGRRWALAAGLAYTASLVPFTAAKLMLAEQVFTALVLGAIWSLSQYWLRRERRFLILTTVLATGAMFTRWEAQFLVALSLTAMLVIAIRHDRSQLRTWAACVAAVLVLCAGWSAYRAYRTGDARIFGTLQNGTGDQLFWHLYIYMGPEVYQWERIFDAQTDARRRAEPPEAITGYRLIRPGNGPATRELADVIRRIARRRPAEILFSAERVAPGRGGFLTRLHGDPEELVREIFEEPNQIYVFSVPSELRTELGPRDAERLLMAVNLEAIRQHPTFFASKLSVALTMAGISIDTGLLVRELNIRRHGGYPAEGRFRDLPSNWVIMRQWSDIHYANVPFDLGNCATISLPPRMVDEYRWDVGLPRATDAFVTVMSLGRNLLRNMVGPVFLLALVGLPFAPAAPLFLALTGTLIALIGIAGTLGGGAYSRYEYCVLPLMLIATVGGLKGLNNLRARLATARRARVHADGAQV
jgi:hypothetical protein